MPTCLDVSKSSDHSYPHLLCPAGKRVLILNGPYRATEALLNSIDVKKFSASLILDSVKDTKWPLSVNAPTVSDPPLVYGRWITVSK